MNNRNNNRHFIDSLLEIKLDGMQLNGRTITISNTGISVLTPIQIQLGKNISFKCPYIKPIEDFEGMGQVVWCVKSDHGYISGVKITDLKNRESLLDYLSLFEKFKKKRNLLKTILMIGVPLIPAYSLILSLTIKTNPYRWPLSIFLSLLIIERLWETFFTCGDKKSIESSNDWTITAVTFYYLLMYFLCISESFFFKRQINFYSSALGVILLMCSFLLRFWSMKSLGKAWAVHVTNTDSGNNFQKPLVIQGPYKYIRHPIYLAVIIELISIPIFSQAYLTFLFVLAVNIPLQIVRSRIEELEIVSQLNKRYLEYAHNVPAFIPKINNERLRISKPH